MTQLGLFEQTASPAAGLGERHRLDTDGERLLATFQAARTAEGAAPQSVRRETSQLRSLLREAHAIDETVMLRSLFSDVELLARCLREPVTAISRSTGRVRLLAVQRLIRAVGPALGRDPSADLAALDALLPMRRSAGWHTTGTLVAGMAGRRRRRGPTLDATDLRRLVDVAGAVEEGQADRNRALVALHCFTGLRPEEIVRLRWEDLSAELTATGHYGLTATVERRGRRVSLLLPSPAADALTALAANAENSESLSGPVFRASRTSDRPLSYRAARDVLQDAFRRAGLPPVESISLRAACAHWLRSQGLSDHEIATVLGLSKVRSVDRLLSFHAALNAQRTVTELLARYP